MAASGKHRDSLSVAASAIISGVGRGMQGGEAAVRVAAAREVGLPLHLPAVDGAAESLRSTAACPSLLQKNGFGSHQTPPPRSLAAELRSPRGLICADSPVRLGAGRGIPAVTPLLPSGCDHALPPPFFFLCQPDTEGVSLLSVFSPLLLLLLLLGVGWVEKPRLGWLAGAAAGRRKGGGLCSRNGAGGIKEWAVPGQRRGSAAWRRKDFVLWR